ncbi:MAG: AraC family transcriptional regulator [Alphaproteobacteria bacterium]
MIFSSKDLPAHLGDRPRFNLWRDIFSAEIASMEFGMSENLPFQVTFQANPVGPLMYAKTFGTITRGARTARDIGTDTEDCYWLFLNMGDRPMGGTYAKREVVVAPGGAFLDAAEPQDMIGGGDRNNWVNVGIPKPLLDASFARIRDRHGLEIDPGHEALQLMRGYLGLIDAGRFPSHPDIATHMAATIVDLVGLATGAKGDEADLAGLRGLRAARLEAVLAHIRGNYVDPALSAQSVGRSLGLSARYIQDLLATTGSGLSDRVLEMRLQHARTLLGSRQYMAMRVAEIAFASGFGDISYFNRRFRMRFGCSPGAAR